MRVLPLLATYAAKNLRKAPSQAPDLSNPVVPAVP
jgi:hypothetical protein